jgi:UDP-N-acetylglucosamine 2-epimerase
VKVVTIVGARPQFIKAAPVSSALRSRAREVLVHTGQHYDEEMSRIFFEELGIPEPDVDLGVGSGSHGQQTGRMLESIEGVLIDESPDWVLVYGDTNSTLAGALAAVKLHIPLAHVEAGLRSFNRLMPEEINRVVVDHVAELLFCPTETSVRNLADEGVTRGVEFVGDVMVDAIDSMRPHLDTEAARRLGIEGEYLVATIHRAETVDDRGRLGHALDLLAAMPLPVIFPVHPRTASALAGVPLPDNVRGIRPVGYREMLSLVRDAEVVLTDSGGLQKEAVLLGTPCITLRTETEWVETVDTGMNRVVDLDASAALLALRDLKGMRADVSRIFPTGAAARIVDLLTLAS